jgi:hypothetical protein
MYYKSNYSIRRYSLYPGEILRNSRENNEFITEKYPSTNGKSYPALFILFFSVSSASGRRPVFCRFQPVLKMGSKPQPLRVSTPLHLTPDPSPQVEGRKDKGVETHRGTGLEAGNN